MACFLHAHVSQEINTVGVDPLEQQSGSAAVQYRDFMLCEKRTCLTCAVKNVSSCVGPSTWLACQQDINLSTASLVHGLGYRLSTPSLLRTVDAFISCPSV